MQWVLFSFVMFLEVFFLEKSLKFVILLQTRTHTMNLMLLKIVSNFSTIGHNMHMNAHYNSVEFCTRSLWECFFSTQVPLLWFQWDFSQIPMTIILEDNSNLFYWSLDIHFWGTINIIIGHSELSPLLMVSFGLLPNFSAMVKHCHHYTCNGSIMFIWTITHKNSDSQLSSLLLLIVKYHLKVIISYG